MTTSIPEENGPKLPPEEISKLALRRLVEICTERELRKIYRLYRRYDPKIACLDGASKENE